MIMFQRASEPLLGYADADWANCKEDRRSYSGFHFPWEVPPRQWHSHVSELNIMLWEKPRKKPSPYLRKLLSEMEFSNSDCSTKINIMITKEHRNW